MTTTRSVPAPAGMVPSRPVRYMLWGGLAGTIAAWLAMFVMALLDGQMHGLSTGSCVVYGCVVTLLLSQPVGLGGMLAGASMGALAGCTVHAMLERRPADR